MLSKSRKILGHEGWLLFEGSLSMQEEEICLDFIEGIIKNLLNSISKKNSFEKDWVKGVLITT